MKFQAHLHGLHDEAALWVTVLLSALPLALLHWLALRYSGG